MFSSRNSDFTARTLSTCSNITRLAVHLLSNIRALANRDGVVSSVPFPDVLNDSIYYNTVQAVALRGCETWSLILKEKHGLKAFEIRVMRIFGSTRDEVTG
jgi:hypothetical protein